MKEQRPDVIATHSTLHQVVSKTLLEELAAIAKDARYELIAESP